MTHAFVQPQPYIPGESSLSSAAEFFAHLYAQDVVAAASERPPDVRHLTGTFLNLIAASSIHMLETGFRHPESIESFVGDALQRAVDLRKSEELSFAMPALTRSEWRYVISQSFATIHDTERTYDYTIDYPRTFQRLSTGEEFHLVSDEYTAKLGSALLLAFGRTLRA